MGDIHGVSLIADILVDAQNVDRGGRAGGRSINAYPT